jgi:hypothetical protein
LVADFAEAPILEDQEWQRERARTGRAQDAHELQLTFDRVAKEAWNGTEPTGSGAYGNVPEAAEVSPLAQVERCATR